MFNSLDVTMEDIKIIRKHGKYALVEIINNKMRTIYENSNKCIVEEYKQLKY